MKFLNQFFTDHPEIRQQYVNTGLVTLNYIVKPLDLFMQHLMVVQNIDPKTKPGERSQYILNKVFDNVHEKDFDDNYDFSWLRKSFKKTQKAMPNLDMSPAQYHRVTDIGSLVSPPAKEDSFFTEAAEQDNLIMSTDPNLYPNTETNKKLIEGRRNSNETVLSPTLVENLLNKEYKAKRRAESMENAKKYLSGIVDKSRKEFNETFKEVQLEKKAPETLKEVIAAVKQYEVERNVEKVFKKMVAEADDQTELEERIDVQSLEPKNSLRAALNKLIEFANKIEESPVLKKTPHREGNSLVRKEFIEKGKIKRS